MGTKAENTKAVGQHGKYVCEVKRTLKKKTKQRQYNKNIVKRVFYITKQTNYHINEQCAYMGISEKQGGKVVDKLMAIHQAATRGGRTK